MKSISIDIETYSAVNLKTCGVYKYSECDKFRLLLFGYSIDGSPVQVVDVENGEKIPAEIIAALTDDDVIKWAYNANFERVCLSRWFLPKGNFYNPKSWRCTMVWAATLGLPLSLAGASAALNLKVQKMDGADLISKFCKPQKNNQQSLMEDEDWETFKKYNCRDVEVELELKSKLADFPVSEDEWDLYAIDQSINDRGALLPEGRVAFVEVKRYGLKPTPLQEARHGMLRRLGFQVFVLDDISQIGGIIDAIQST